MNLDLKIEAKDENLEELNNHIHKLICKDCDENTVNFIDLAVEEIFVNICHYAYKERPEKTGNVEISISYDNSVLEISFSDNGKAFNPLQKKDPDLTLSAEERDIGGLGIFLTKKYMDNVEYEYQNGRNVLRIKKTIL